MILFINISQQLFWWLAITACDWFQSLSSTATTTATGWWLLHTWRNRAFCKISPSSYTSSWPVISTYMIVQRQVSLHLRPLNFSTHATHFWRFPNFLHTCIYHVCDCDASYIISFILFLLNFVIKKIRWMLKFWNLLVILSCFLNNFLLMLWEMSSSDLFANQNNINQNQGKWYKRL